MNVSLIKPAPLRFRFNHILNCWEQYGFKRNQFAPIWRWFIVPTHWVKECLDRKCANIEVESTISAKEINHHESSSPTNHSARIS